MFFNFKKIVDIKNIELQELAVAFGNLHCLSIIRTRDFSLLSQAISAFLVFWKLLYRISNLRV